MNPDARLVSDAERNRVVAQLRQACVDGRLGVEEFSHRVEAAMAARTAGQLAALTDDLSTKPCPYCATQIGASVRFCPNCGARLLQQARAAQPAASIRPAAMAPAISDGGQKDPGLAFLLELLPGQLGFAGLGHIYSGQVARGVLLLVAYWVFVSFEIGLMALLVGFCMLPLNLVIPILSAFWVRQELQKRRLPTRGQQQLA